MVRRWRYFSILPLAGCTGHHLARNAAVFGFLTGTIASGLALLRMVDPELDTPVAEELACAGGLSLLVGFPLLLMLNFPLYAVSLPECRCAIS